MAFFEKIYQIVKKIPKGKVATYGQIAEMLGTKDARRVGWALHANRDEGTPCHRVVNRKGGLAANFAFDGEKEQKIRLLKEGVTFNKKGEVDLKKHLWTP
ncbi:cysteine methyltransferase [Candidatus Woesebacteria bacterium RBG_19FT_COMBO_47_8]|uniref:Cysteine methyltransferase n=1 Tax=Candidatus Woesebacteria bacterium RBG_13_46_13 TaxID=1802479 RepID=A0A1F7X4Z9_9BACT|nr:MAG: cysteine methyltransferase [Candidatus Woesebacteria bacterium RBG_13_46_13]OGM17499.1 MAG: cysteine methyltransferase [Candidatus Woesebacteria bacterium RBG_19FT_COMBO_47_8]HJX59242.1 methylated-DNA--[protein]-cysteine S-methyltransferase [Patescibacteria group bacterium]